MRTASPATSRSFLPGHAVWTAGHYRDLSTALGPALGGARFYPYPDEDAALADALNLSRAMAYKNALAGLDLGGGKAVIIGDPAELKSEALLRAYGRFVESLNSRYITACDIGTYSEDMDIVRARARTSPAGPCRTAGPVTHPSSPRSASSRACARPPTTSGVTPAWPGRPSASRASARSGTGSRITCPRTAPRSWSSTPTPPRQRGYSPRIRTSRSRRAAMTCSPVSSTCTRRAPWAEPSTSDTVHSLRCPDHLRRGERPARPPRHGEDAGRLRHHLAPDYLVNSGGVIQVADELHGFNFERAKARAEQIFTTTRQILAAADADGVPPAVAADRLAERRIAEVGRLGAYTWAADHFLSRSAEAPTAQSRYGCTCASGRARRPAGGGVAAG